jgi:demethylmenaquinone methyltransferase/2-methoxy-6-polyprenyl-1,4-benzoquinol methylase
VSVRQRGDRVLEIGCGTGTVTEQLVARGARVVAIDQSPEMIELAKARVVGDVEWREQTAAEIDRLPKGAFDAVVVCLCLSDMSGSERRFVLAESVERLGEDGVLIVADEMQAPRGWRRALQLAWRGPQAALAWLLVGSISRPLADLRSELRNAGLEIVREQRWMFGTLGLYEARRR